MGWKKLSSKYVYQNPWIKVREDQVIQPDGKKSIYGVVEAHFGAAVVAVDRQKRIILVGQTRYPLGDYSWEVPSGAVEEKEKSLTAVKRELLEETGLKARKWHFLGKSYPSPGIIKAVDSYFLASSLYNSNYPHDGTEDITVKSASLAEIEDMIDKGDILDAMTIVAIYKYKAFLKRKKK